jgi:PAS domain S-box-containing protein
MESVAPDTLLAEIARLRSQLAEVNDTLEAIRTGQVDALVVNGANGHELYTLKTADHAYRAFIEQMTEGAVTLNAAGLIIYCNSRLSKLVNTPLSGVLGSEFAKYITPECQEAYKDLFEEGWENPVKGEIKLVGKPVNIPVSLSINKLDLEDEPALSIIVADLTAQKETQLQLQLKNEQLETLNQALIDSNHDLQQFASVASHDLQEPLRKIQVFSKFLKDRSFTELSEQSKAYVEKIILSSQRMKVLIVDILNYSRLSADNEHIETIDLQTLVEEIVDDFDLKITEKKAKVDLGPLPVVEGNRGQLRQVFYNLISNALKFSHPDKVCQISISTKDFNARELGLSLTDEDQCCRIIVKDNGIGFDEQFAHSIFNLFEKLNSNSAFEGSGIGLAIAKKIIDKHHGLIIARSSAGEGAEFNIVLPFKYRKR